MREGSLHMKARLARHTRAGLAILALMVAGPLWANPLPASHSITPAPHDDARTPAASTRLAWDRVGAPLQGMS